MPWPTPASVLAWRSAWRGLGGRGSSTPRSSALASFGAGEVRLEPAAVATMAMATVARFCRSADAEVNASHFSAPEGLGAAYVEPLTDQVVALAQKAWADLTAGPAGKLRPTHDTYLKQWQLSGPHLDYDVVLYDEAQDADACVADVVSRQSHAQLVAVGDSAQAIYGWRGAGDFLATVAARHRLALTQSWRFGQAIADEANVWLGVVGSGVRVVGNPSRSSVLSKLAHPDAVLCRSNAATIDEVLAAHTTGTKVHLEGDGTEMAGPGPGGATYAGRPTSRAPRAGCLPRLGGGAGLCRERPQRH